MRVQLSPSAHVDHVTGFIAAPEAAQVMAGLRDELAWGEREIVLYGRRVLQPRLVAWAGALPYRYSGQTLEPRAFTATVSALIDRVASAAGASFNHVLANRYRNGHDSMGFHADNEPELGDDPVVATLSFGASRRFVVVPHCREPGVRHDFTLASGDLLIMAGTCQRDFRHAIPRTAQAVDERISLTFRQVLRAPPG